MTHYNTNDVTKHSITFVFVQDETLSDDSGLIDQLRIIAQQQVAALDYIPDINGLYPFQVTFDDPEQTSLVLNLKLMAFDKTERELAWWCAAIAPTEINIVAALPEQARAGYIARLVRMTDSQRALWCEIHGA